jgi:gas vesicle protein GvpL/GvpF
MSGSATYVYCVVHRPTRPPLTRMPPGIAGASAAAIDSIARGLWLVSASVPLDEYAEREIQERLQDLDWVSRIALAHEAIVERFGRAASATVIPMKLFTIFSTPARALEEMRRRRPQLESVAKRVRGAEEWGVRIMRTQDGSPAARGAAQPAASGTAFLAAKRRARDEAQARATAAVEAAEHAFVVLGRFARQTKRQPPPSGAPAPPLLDAALLVPSGRKLRFKAAVNREARRCRDAGADLTLTGPWPAYNFIQSPDGWQ